MYVCICMYMHVYVCIRVYMYVYVCSCLYVCMCVCTYTYIHMHMHINKYIYNMYMHTRLCVSIYTPTYTFSHASPSRLLLCFSVEQSRSCFCCRSHHLCARACCGRTYLSCLGACPACPVSSLRIRHEECLVKKGAKRGPVGKGPAQVQSQFVACCILKS